MGTTQRRLVIGLVGVLSGLVSVWALALPTELTRSIPYSGHLDLDGVPMSGPVTLSFHVWNAPTGGTELFTQTGTSATVSNGAFAVLLNGVPDSVFNSNAVYVGVDVGGTPLVGRQALVPSAQAVRAAQAYNFTVSQNLQVDGQITSNLNAVIRGAEIGASAHPNYVGVSAAGRNNLTDYGLIQSTDGSATLLNASPTGSVQLRLGNVPRVTADPTNITLNGNTSVTGMLDIGFQHLDCGANMDTCWCPAGKTAIAGGGRCASNLPLFNNSRVTNGAISGWRVYCESASTVTNVFAICARVN